MRFKLTILAIIILYAQTTWAQSSKMDIVIQLNESSGSISHFLETIKKQANAEFYYDNSKVDVSQKVKISERKMTVRNLLNLLFKEQAVQFMEQKNAIIIKVKKGSSGKGIKGKKVTIKGYLRDADSGEALIGSTAMNLETLAGTISNYYGFYSLTLPAGPITLKYSYVGYEAQVKQLNVQKDTTISVDLSIATLNEIIINADKEVPIQETTAMGTFTVTSKEIKSRPAIGGEVDVVKALHLLPGVQSGSEGSSGLYIRGGGPDQNLILLDGVPIYNVNHLFGFMSVFNADAINKVDLIKGAYPARYGGRLSSVVDISMKEGNNQEFHGEGSVGLIATKLLLEGPIIKGKTSYAISGRRTYLDVFAKPFFKDKSSTDPQTGNTTTTGSSVGYYFYDVTGKINHKFSDRDRVFFSIYHGKDKGSSGEKITEENSQTDYYRFNDDAKGLHWGSTISLFRWNHVFAPKLFANTSISYSRYDFFSEDENFLELNFGDDRRTTYENFTTTSGIEDWTARIDFDFFPNPNHNMKFGISGIKHTFSPNTVALNEDKKKDVTINTNNIETKEYFAYLEDDIKWSEKIRSNIGVHVSGYEVNDKFYHSIQPRISLRYLLNTNNSVKASYTHMAQYLHMLTNAGVGLPTDFWVPATEQIPPQRADQFSLGWFHSNASTNLEFSAEAYYKQMNGMIAYKEGAGFLDLSEHWENKVEIGEGSSYGIELYVKKSFGRTDGWIGYTLSRSDRFFPNLNEGKTFPFKYDRRHDISAVLNHKISDNITLNANWVFGSGTTITLPESIYYTNDSYFAGQVFEYTSRNGYRMRPYHRLDLSVSFTKEKKWGERQWVIGIYNVYSRRNPYFVEEKHHIELENRDGIYHTVDEHTKLVEKKLFPIIPSISYRFKF
ncbi:MAG: TonB-dependent receptor [Reichenbachiella sp.]|uniref:TonB-dependent receptor n=1 Tax=Reichenbachiella sp. TaxID=2184521 RepID=UPI003267B78D